MKCILLTDRTRKNPAYDHKKAREMAARLLPYRVPFELSVPAGTILDHPLAHVQVHLGLAEPADDECREATKHLTPEYIAKQREKYEKLNRGQATGNKFYDSDLQK